MFALFINGVYESVLEEILAIQSELPEHIMFLQPHATSRIVKLHDSPPTVDDPITLFASTTEDLSTVKYKAEIVGYDDKRQLDEHRERVLNRLIWTLQPNEGGLYRLRDDGSDYVNLLHVRRMKKVHKPYSVSELTNVKNDQPLAEGRSTAGGWIYVNPHQEAA
jgi:hypothetical protein